MWCFSEVYFTCVTNPFVNLFLLCSTLLFKNTQGCFYCFFQSILCKHHILYMQLHLSQNPAMGVGCEILTLLRIQQNLSALPGSSASVGMRRAKPHPIPRSGQAPPAAPERWEVMNQCLGFRLPKQQPVLCLSPCRALIWTYSVISSQTSLMAIEMLNLHTSVTEQLCYVNQIVKFINTAWKWS